MAKVFESVREIAEKAGDSLATAECLLLALSMATSTPSADALSKPGLTRNC